MDSLNVNKHIMNMQRNFSSSSGSNAFYQPFTMLVFQMPGFMPQNFLFSNSYQAPIFNFNQAPQIDTYSFVGDTLSNLSFDRLSQAQTSTQGFMTSTPVFSMPKLTIPKLSKNFISATRNTSELNFDTSIKYKSLKEAGYNANLAQRLAKDVASHVEAGSTGYCAKYVSNSLERLGIAGARGDAYELRDSLRNNPHFKEVDVNSVDIKNLPAGCILVYQQGAAGYSNAYGHVEITLGNGKAASDYINDNIKASLNMNIFVPVTA